jgi:ectoine hydroxylase-related dioxygenase (phytanoyl-CoA dioxygenase family)
MSSKITNLPALDERLTLLVEQIREFQTNGHILIKNLSNSHEIDVYRTEIVRAAEEFNTERRKLEERDTYGKAFLQIMNLWTKDDAVKKFVTAKRFAKVAADLMGVENVRIYHDQALFKESGGGHTPWHQDQYYWPVDTTNMVTMWMPLVDLNEDMGILTFGSGSQKNWDIFDFVISDESHKGFDDYVKEQDFPVVSAKKMNAGDATFHYGCTIHSAPSNSSAKTREIMTVIYIADGAKITEPVNKWQENDRQQWLQNYPVGALVASELNPLLL